MRTFLERDIPQLGIAIPSATLERFWSMLAHYHAQTWNGSELARAFGVSHHVMRRYLDALEATFMVRALKPWSANLGKRQVKAPKVYIRDSGLLHRLLDVGTRDALERHPKVGASWEGFVIENLIRAVGADERQCYFWATHSGAEIESDRAEPRPAAGIRGQAHELTGHHPFDAIGGHRPGAALPGRHSCR